MSSVPRAESAKEIEHLGLGGFVADSGARFAARSASTPRLRHKLRVPSLAPGSVDNPSTAGCNSNERGQAANQGLPSGSILLLAIQHSLRSLVQPQSESPTASRTLCGLIKQFSHPRAAPPDASSPICPNASKTSRLAFLQTHPLSRLFGILFSFPPENRRKGTQELQRDALLCVCSALHDCVMHRAPVYIFKRSSGC